MNSQHLSTQSCPSPDAAGVVYVRVTRVTLPGGCVYLGPPPWYWNLKQILAQHQTMTESMADEGTAA